MTTPKNILVPLDFSETSPAVQAYAQTLAKGLGARLHLLHVVPSPFGQAYSIDSSGITAKLIESLESEAQTRLARLPLDDAPAERVTRVGQPHAEIIRYASAHEIDLIVMGAEGRGAVERLLLGGVTEKVIRTASCPVLTVRKT